MAKREIKTEIKTELSHITCCFDLNILGLKMRAQTNLGLKTARLLWRESQMDLLLIARTDAGVAGGYFQLQNVRVGMVGYWLEAKHSIALRIRHASVRPSRDPAH